MSKHYSLWPDKSCLNNLQQLFIPTISSPSTVSKPCSLPSQNGIRFPHFFDPEPHWAWSCHFTSGYPSWGDRQKPTNIIRLWNSTTVVLQLPISQLVELLPLVSSLTTILTMCPLCIYTLNCQQGVTHPNLTVSPWVRPTSARACDFVTTSTNFIKNFSSTLLKLNVDTSSCWFPSDFQLQDSVRLATLMSRLIPPIQHNLPRSFRNSLDCTKYCTTQHHSITLNFRTVSAATPCFPHLNVGTATPESNPRSNPPPTLPITVDDKPEFKDFWNPWYQDRQSTVPCKLLYLVHWTGYEHVEETSWISLLNSVMPRNLFPTSQAYPAKTWPIVSLFFRLWFQCFPFFKDHTYNFSVQETLITISTS